ncbi:STAS domain-containing protein [Rossellomorea aquimaris]|uniref:STAS domain-containing protein n=1 Tax=Rossellomorea aquimaris TaxID=189382 RepID=UPI0007D04C89|nr:STAS domain-containing protein [Rossellomorea aquimaris]
MSIGNFDQSLLSEEILESISEPILLANLQYEIQWMNNKAAVSLTPLFQLYGLRSSEEAIGQSMDFFHSNPHKQREMMKEVTKSIRTRITIQNQYVAETVISPIKNHNREIIGYVLMLLDVTHQAEEEQRKNELISALSIPILRIWNDVMAIPILGDLTNDRADKLVEKALTYSVKHRMEYILIDLSSLAAIDESTGYHVNRLCEAANLIGTKCYVVGVSPSLSLSIVQSNMKWETFTHVQQAIQYILASNHLEISQKL